MAEQPARSRPLPSISRVVVGLDGSPGSFAALEAAADLATYLDVELRGVFVEDSDLLAFAGLPFASVIGPSSAQVVHLDAAAVERGLRHRAQRVRRSVARAAGQRGLRWSFVTARGPVAALLIEAAAERGVLSIGWRHGSSRAAGIGRAVRPGSVVPAAVAGARGPLMMLRPDPRSRRRTVVAVVSNADADGELVRVAAALASRSGGRLMGVTLPGQGEAVAQMLSETLPARRGARVREAPSTLPGAELAEALRVAPPALLVLRREHYRFDAELLRELSRYAGLSLLLV